VSALLDEERVPLRFRDVFDPADWPEVARDTHLVDGLLSTTLTVLAADPAVGKTNYAVGLAAALLNGEGAFLGREVLAEVDSVAFLSTDADGANSVRRRISPLVDDFAGKRVHALDYPVAGGFDWDDLVEAVEDVGAELLVVDNAPGLVDDINAFSEAKRVTRPLLRLTEQGTAVLLLTHTAKPGLRGPAQGVNSPMGTRYWTIPARVKCSLTSRESDGRKRLKAANNDGAFVQVDARLDVVSDAPMWTLWEDVPAPREEVLTGSPEIWQALADVVLHDQPAAASLRALGEHYAEGVGLSAYTVRTRMAGLVEHDGQRWRRPG
jgi:hypothetical protein